MLLFIPLGVFLVIWMVEWGIHVSMNTDTQLPYDFVTFKTFMKEFDKYKDNPDLQKYACSGKSIFLYKNEVYVVYLHAGIVKFNEKCMIFYPVDYIKYCLWMNKFNKKPRKKYRQKGLWK